jgi:hypothetical protein
MTVQAGVELDLDIAALVGEMEELPCEHGEHQTDPIWHDQGPSSHYLRGACDCGREPVVFAACNKFVDHVTANCIMRCSKCKIERPATDFLTVLAPVKP